MAGGPVRRMGHGDDGPALTVGRAALDGPDEMDILSGPLRNRVRDVGPFGPAGWLELKRGTHGQSEPFPHQDDLLDRPAENIALLVVLTGLLIWRAGEVHWWRAVAAFWIIDIVGYIPGAIAFKYSKDGRISRWFYNSYNIAHTYLVTGTGVALWAYAIGGFEWAMLGVPIHLCVDRGVFGNTLKPVELSFEP